MISRSILISDLWRDLRRRNQSFMKLKYHICIVGSIELRSNAEKMVTLISSHLKTTSIEASDQNTIWGYPNRLGASTSNVREIRSRHALIFGFEFASTGSIGVHDTLGREKSWVQYHQAYLYLALIKIWGKILDKHKRGQKDSSQGSVSGTTPPWTINVEFLIIVKAPRMVSHHCNARISVLNNL